MAEIKYQGSSNPMFSHVVDGFEYAFSVNMIEDEYWEWFTAILGDHMDQIAERAYRDGRKDVQIEMRNALGLEK